MAVAVAVADCVAVCCALCAVAVRCSCVLWLWLYADCVAVRGALWLRLCADCVALQHAGIYLREGEMYLKFENHPSTPEQIQHAIFLHSAKYCTAELCFALLYMLLAILEYPVGTASVGLYFCCFGPVICRPTTRDAVWHARRIAHMLVLATSTFFLEPFRTCFSTPRCPTRAV